MLEKIWFQICKKVPGPLIVILLGRIGYVLLFSGFLRLLLKGNRPRSIHQYSNMPPRLSLQTSIFSGVFFVSKSLLGIVRQKKLKMFKRFSRKRRVHVGILIYRTRPIDHRRIRLTCLHPCCHPIQIT